MNNFSNFFHLKEAIKDKVPGLMKRYPQFTEADIVEIGMFDPTGNKGKFIEWMTRQVSNKQIRFPEDGQQTKEDLERFMKLVKVPTYNGPKDINQIKFYADLVGILNQNEATKSKGEQVKVAEEEGVTQILEQGVYKIFKITTKEGATKICKHTRWCVKDPKFAEGYLAGGPLYVITKYDNPYILFTFGGDREDEIDPQIKGVDDEGISPEMAKEVKPLLKQFPEFTEMIFKYTNVSKEDMITYEEALGSTHAKMIGRGFTFENLFYRYGPNTEDEDSTSPRGTILSPKGIVSKKHIDNDIYKLGWKFTQYPIEVLEKEDQHVYALYGDDKISPHNKKILAEFYLASITPEGQRTDRQHKIEKALRGITTLYMQDVRFYTISNLPFSAREAYYDVFHNDWFVFADASSNIRDYEEYVADMFYKRIVKRMQTASQ